MPSKPLKSPTSEGRRERKRRETHKRISEVALGMFVKRGFHAVTVDEIAMVADVSTRSFFDYFPSKEDVVTDWQDEFGITLAEAVASRPSDEPLGLIAERAMIDALTVAARPEAIALDRLIRDTPTLYARSQAKYARLETIMFEALMKRADDELRSLEAQLLAMIAIGVMRIGTRAWFAQGSADRAAGLAYSQQSFGAAWREVRQLFPADAIPRSAPQKGSKVRRPKPAA